MREPLPVPAADPDDDPDDVRRREILAAHDAAVAAGEPLYLDPATGLYVMTSAFLRDRGHCCGSGCRHCPYD